MFFALFGLSFQSTLKRLPVKKINFNLPEKRSKKLNTPSIKTVLLVLKPTPQVPPKSSATRDQHLETVDCVKRVLAERGIAYDTVIRKKGGLIRVNHDLVITVGGDGTFLDAAHSLTDVPLFGVNSAPISSFGNYCLAQSKNFDIMLDRILSGKEYCYKLARLAMTLDGNSISMLALNEVLVTGGNPAATCCYQLQVGGEISNQKSSGLIIATPTGTTGLLHSAGGEVLPLTAEKFAYQVLARFGLPGERDHLNSGFVPFGDRIQVVSRMENGKIFLDGPNIEYAFKRGSVLEVAIDPNPLKAYVYPYRHMDYDAYQLACRRAGGEGIG